MGEKFSTVKEGKLNFDLCDVMTSIKKIYIFSSVYSTPIYYHKNLFTNSKKDLNFIKICVV